MAEGQAVGEREAAPPDAEAAGREAVGGAGEGEGDAVAGTAELEGAPPLADTLAVGDGERAALREGDAPGVPLAVSAGEREAEGLPMGEAEVAGESEGRAVPRALWEAAGEPEARPSAGVAVGGFEGEAPPDAVPLSLALREPGGEGGGVSVAPPPVGLLEGGRLSPPLPLGGALPRGVAVGASGVGVGGPVGVNEPLGEAGAGEGEWSALREAGAPLPLPRGEVDILPLAVAVGEEEGESARFGEGVAAGAVGVGEAAAVGAPEAVAAAEGGGDCEAEGCAGVAVPPPPAGAPPVGDIDAVAAPLCDPRGVGEAPPPKRGRGHPRV